MARMTEQEAWELDDFVTNNDISLGPSGSGWLAQRDLRTIGLDNLAINYIMTKAQATNKSPAQIIGELIRKEIAGSM